MSSTLAWSDLLYMPARPRPATSSSLLLWRPDTASCQLELGTFSSSPITWPETHLVSLGGHAHVNNNTYCHCKPAPLLGIIVWSPLLEPLNEGCCNICWLGKMQNPRIEYMLNDKGISYKIYHLTLDIQVALC